MLLEGNAHFFLRMSNFWAEAEYSFKNMHLKMRITELGFNFLNKVIVFFVDSRVQNSIFGLFCQCLYSYHNKGTRGARVQNHSTVTRGYLNNLQKAILLGLG